MTRLKRFEKMLYPYDKETGEIYAVDIQASDFDKARLRVMVAATQLGLQIAISARGARRIVKGFGLEPKLSNYRITIF